MNKNVIFTWMALVLFWGITPKLRGDEPTTDAHEGDGAAEAPKSRVEKKEKIKDEGEIEKRVNDLQGTVREFRSELRSDKCEKVKGSDGDAIADFLKEFDEALEKAKDRNSRDAEYAAKLRAYAIVLERVFQLRENKEGIDEETKKKLKQWHNLIRTQMMKVAETEAFDTLEYPTANDVNVFLSEKANPPQDPNNEKEDTRSNYKKFEETFPSGHKVISAVKDSKSVCVADEPSKDTASNGGRKSTRSGGDGSTGGETGATTPPGKKTTEEQMAELRKLIEEELKKQKAELSKLINDRDNRDPSKEKEKEDRIKRLEDLLTQLPAMADQKLQEILRQVSQARPDNEGNIPWDKIMELARGRQQGGESPSTGGGGAPSMPPMAMQPQNDQKPAIDPSLLPLLQGLAGQGGGFNPAMLPFLNGLGGQNSGQTSSSPTVQRPDPFLTNALDRTSRQLERSDARLYESQFANARLQAERNAPVAPFGPFAGGFTGAPWGQPGMGAFGGPFAGVPTGPFGGRMGLANINTNQRMRFGLTSGGNPIMRGSSTTGRAMALGYGTKNPPPANVLGSSLNTF